LESKKEKIERDDCPMEKNPTTSNKKNVRVCNDKRKTKKVHRSTAREAQFDCASWFRAREPWREARQRKNKKSRNKGMLKGNGQKVLPTAVRPKNAAATSRKLKEWNRLARAGKGGKDHSPLYRRAKIKLWGTENLKRGGDSNKKNRQGRKKKA